MFLQKLLDHLSEICPTCRENLHLLLSDEEPAEGWLGTAVPPVVADPPTAATYATAFAGAERRVADRSGALRKEQHRARRDLGDLLRLPAEQRERRIVNARTRFRSRSLAEMLLEESRRTVRRDAVEAKRLADLVPVVILWTPGALDQPWAHSLELRSLGQRANALRVAGDLKAASDDFARVRRLLADAPPQDVEVLAELGSLEASLRFDQRRLDEAAALLERVIELQTELTDEAGLAKSRVQKSACEAERGNLPQAISDLQQALELIDRRDQVHLYLCAVSNLTLCYCRAERFSEARRLLDDHRTLYAEHADTWTEPRLALVEGQVEQGLGHHREAERLFLGARDHFIGEGNGYEAALASLDLAMLYLEQRRLGELKQVARLMQPIFESQDVHREAVAALILFQQAAAAERVTAETIRKLRSYLESSRGNPGLQVEQAS